MPGQQALYIQETCIYNPLLRESKMRRQESKLAQIKQHLTDGIKFRHFKDRLPSENQLAAKFKVSRMTARKALSKLESAGLVERIQGKGTFVKKHDFATGYFTVQPSRKHAEALNLAYSPKVLELRMLAQPPADIISKLNYDGQTILTRRLHFFGGIAMRYEVRYLRGDLCGGILWEDLEKNSIHELLVYKYDLPLTKVWQRITAETMTEKISRIFEEDPGYPAFHIYRTTYTFETPVTFVEYFIRGDLAFEDTFAPEPLNNR
jgi:GntR family transcriptional regulator